MLMNPQDTGDIGELESAIALIKNGIRNAPIKDVYDTVLIEKGYRVEIKTSNIYQERNSKRPSNTYRFNFKKSQLMKDAFDYALCVGIDMNGLPEVFYMIPQKYLHERNHRVVCVLQNNDMCAQYGSNYSKLSYYNTYDKYSICRNNWDALKLDRPAFMRKENYITKKLLNFKETEKKRIVKEFVNAAKHGKRREVTQAILDVCKKYNVSRNTFNRVINGHVSYRGEWKHHVNGYSNYTKEENKKLMKEVKKLHKKGYTFKQMMEKLNLSNGKLSSLRNKLGITKRRMK